MRAAGNLGASVEVGSPRIEHLLARVGLPRLASAADGEGREGLPVVPRQGDSLPSGRHQGGRLLRGHPVGGPPRANARGDDGGREADGIFHVVHSPQSYQRDMRGF